MVQEGASRLQKKTKKREMGKISIDKVCRRRTPPSVGRGGEENPSLMSRAMKKGVVAGELFSRMALGAGSGRRLPPEIGGVAGETTSTTTS